MSYYSELDRLNEMEKNCQTLEDLREIEREEAYLIYKGYGHRDYDTGKFIYTGAREMGN